MIGGLFGVDAFSAFVGFVLLLLGIGGKVTADTEFGKYSGPVGAVLLVLGIVLMALGSLW